VREELFDRILDRLHLTLHKESRIDWSGFSVDGLSIRADRSAAGASQKKGARKTRRPGTGTIPAEALARSFIW